jgi:hypothetical protein
MIEHGIMLRADGTGTDLSSDLDNLFNDAVRLMVEDPALSLFDAYDSSTSRLRLDDSDWPRPRSKSGRLSRKTLNMPIPASLT